MTFTFYLPHKGTRTDRRQTTMGILQVFGYVLGACLLTESHNNLIISIGNIVDPGILQFDLLGSFPLALENNNVPGIVFVQKISML